MASAIHRRSAPACHCATSLDLCHELGISNFDGPQQFVRSTSQHRSHMRTSSQKGLLGPTCGEHGPRRNCQRDVPAHSLQVRRLLPLGLLRGPQCSVSGDPRESTDSCQRPAGHARGARLRFRFTATTTRPSVLAFVIRFQKRFRRAHPSIPFHSIPHVPLLCRPAPPVADLPSRFQLPRLFFPVPPAAGKAKSTHPLWPALTPTDQTRRLVRNDPSS